MPTISGDDCGVGLKFAIRSALELFNRAIENFALGFHALTIARVQMFSQTPRFLLVGRIEQINDGFRCVHATRGVDSRSDAKSKIVRSHLAVIATTRDV